MIKTVIFDMDGVLIDSMNVWLEEGYKLLKDLSNINALESVHKDVPIRARTIINDLIEAGYSEEFCYNLHQTWRKNMKQRYLTDIKLKPRVIELLKLLKDKKINIALASATKKELITAVIKHHGIEKYFDYVISVGEVGKDKFHPDIYLSCASYFNTKPEECLVFEDAYHALMTVKKANFKTIGVYDEHSKSLFDKIKEVADYTIHSYDEILDNLFFIEY